MLSQLLDLPQVAESSPILSLNSGVMIWVLITFGVTVFILKKKAFPRIIEVLDERQKKIEGSIDDAAKMRAEADELLAEYRQRLTEARSQAEEIVIRARKSAEQYEQQAIADAKEKHAELLEQSKRDLEAQVEQAGQQIRKEIAILTALATEKVTRKVLTEDDQRRLIDEALSDLDLSSLTGVAKR